MHFYECSLEEGAQFVFYNLKLSEYEAYIVSLISISDYNNKDIYLKRLT